MIDNDKSGALDNDRWALILAGTMLSLVVLIPLFNGRFPFHPFHSEMIMNWIPVRQFMLGAYLDGFFPLWNPYTYGGMPFWAYAHSMSAYPIMWLSLLLPLLWGISFFFLFHIWVSCWGAFRLQRLMGFSPVLSLAGTLLLVGSGYGMEHRGFYINLAAMSWLPALIYIGIRLVRTGSRKYLYAWIVFLSLEFLSGEAEIIAYNMVVVLVFMVVLEPGFFSDFKKRRWPAWVIISLVPLLISALMWLPLAEYMQHNVRSGGVTFAQFHISQPDIIDYSFDLFKVLGLLFHPKVSYGGWIVLFFLVYHLALRRDRRSFIVLGLMTLGLFYGFRIWVGFDKALFHIPVFNLFLRRDQIAAGIIFLAQWLALLGMRDFIESGWSSRHRLAIMILGAGGAVVIAGMYFFERSQEVLAPLLVFLPLTGYVIFHGKRPIGSSIRLLILVVLVLANSYLYLLLKIEVTDEKTFFPKLFKQSAQHLDTSSRHLFVTSLYFEDPDLFDQQSLIYRWPQVFGWTRVPPRRYMEFISLCDPRTIKYENGKLASHDFVYNHFNGAPLKPEAMPLLDLLNLKYVFVNNKALKLVSPYYIVWMTDIEQFMKRRIVDHWRDLLVIDDPLQFDIFARPASTLKLQIAWDSIVPPQPSVPCRVTIMAGSQVLFDRTLELDGTYPGPGISDQLSVALDPIAGSQRTLTIDVRPSKQHRFERLRMHRPGVLDPAMPFQLIESKDHIDIFENREVMPPQFLARRIELFPDKKSIMAGLKTATREKLESTALLIDGRQAREYKRELDRAAPSSSGTGRITKTFHLPGIRRYSANTNRPALAIISQNFLPGWRAFVNRREQKILHVDWAFTGLYLEPGNSEVELIYQPWAFRIALWVSLFSILSFFAIVIKGALPKP